MPRIPNELKIPLVPIKNIFYTLYCKFLKLEEMEYLIHCVKFEMWPALFYVYSHSFPNSSIDWELRFLNVGVRLYFENQDIWMLL